jgi:hypothetical protein
MDIIIPGQILGNRCSVDMVIKELGMQFPAGHRLDKMFICRISIF